MLTQASDINVTDHSYSVVDDSILRIGACRSESEVTQLLQTIIGELRVTAYVFVTLRFDAAGPRNLRYLIGCASAWCQIYSAKKWVYVDPFIQYARRDSSPIARSRITATTPGQSELLASAAEYGFRSGVVIPAHSGDSHRIGVLYLGSDLAAQHIEPQLMERRTQLRAVAMELFEWWESRKRAEIIAELKFKDIDMDLLNLVREGFTAPEIARVLDISIATTQVKLRRLNVKLDVHSKKQAAEKAIQLGILPGY